MLAPVRRLLVAVFIVGCFVALGAAPAQACTCAAAGATGATSGTGALMQRIKDADAVFTGTVTAVEVAGTGASSVITNTVEADRIFKGDLATPEQVVRTTQRTQASCGLGRLKAERRYVFIVQADTTEAADWTDDGCSGTRIATSALITEVRGVLGSGQSTTPPTPPPPAVLTDADVAEPTSLGRMVAPGLALVLVGFLGLILVRRVNARRS